MDRGAWWAPVRGVCKEAPGLSMRTHLMAGSNKKRCKQRDLLEVLL